MTSGSLETDIMEEAELITKDHILEKGDPRNTHIKVIPNDNPAYNNICCVDVSLNATGPAEDSLYALNPSLQKSIRRGNTYIEVYDRSDHLLYKY